MGRENMVIYWTTITILEYHSPLHNTRLILYVAHNNKLHWGNSEEIPLLQLTVLELKVKNVTQGIRNKYYLKATGFKVMPMDSKVVTLSNFSWAQTNETLICLLRKTPMSRKPRHLSLGYNDEEVPGIMRCRDWRVYTENGKKQVSEANTQGVKKEGLRRESRKHGRKELVKRPCWGLWTEVW